MLDKQIINESIGQNGVGSLDVAFVGGIFQVKVSLPVPSIGAEADLLLKLSPKSLIDLLAEKVGGPIPAEVAAFLENAIGLS